VPQVLAVGAHVPLIGANICPILCDVFAVCLNILAIRLDVSLVAVGGGRSPLRIGLARSGCGLPVGGVRCWQRSAED
jgi:hypothetical protein